VTPRAPDQAFVVELPQQLADRCIEFAQTLEAAVTQDGRATIAR
jgi:hypothetical protein